MLARGERSADRSSAEASFAEGRRQPPICIAIVTGDQDARVTSLEPIQRPSPRRGARRKAGLQQIAAGRRFPVEHLAGGEYARKPPQHEAFVKLAPGDAARA